MSTNIFSLEIFIDRIRLLEGEKCLFPSTILKLLDYEPAIVSQIDNELQTKLRDYLDLLEKSKETQMKPTQLNELKDHDGNYVVRKGKSILFQSNTLNLISEFNCLPLYLLICDDYYYSNHLVGVVTIKLSNQIISLAKKISQTNHTVSEDLMGKFPIVNLLGDGIGFITMKLRLIYVGANLVPHLQAEQHVELKIKEKLKNPINKSVECEENLVEVKMPEKILVRNIGCQANNQKSIRIQVPIELDNVGNNLAKVGLTIDPNDPVLIEQPPMIYNSYYGNGEDSDLEQEEKEELNEKNQQEQIKLNSLSKVVKSITKTPETVSILNELLEELKSWKTCKNEINQIYPNEKTVKTIMGKPSKNCFTRVKFQPRKRSKSVETTEENRKEFLKRLSKPKIRANSPLGIVPKAKGWLRTEPEYCGPIRSQLEYKLTKTQSKRIELTNPKLFKKIILRQKSATKPNEFQRPIDSSDFSSSAVELPIARNKRNPLVPPLFGTGTSVSVPSFTGSVVESEATTPPLPPTSAGTGTAAIHGGSNGKLYSRKAINKRPPHSPGKESFNRNNNNNSSNNYFSSKSFDYDTNETVNEADQLLNLNPVQSNRSPHMSRWSNHGPPGDDSLQDNSSASDNHNYSESTAEENAWRSVDNKDNEYSDGFNQSLSMENEDGKNRPRRYSMASQISQTSEWRTDYSTDSSNSQLNNYRKESNNSSPDFAARKLHVKLPTRPKRSSLSSSNINGVNGSNSFRTFESGRPSFNESLEVSNMDSDAVPNEYDDDNNRRSIDQVDDNTSMLRPNSVGADVTSFTKVTKYERSLVPGPMNSNYMGTHLITSTVASLRTEDSQTLTSEAYY